MVVTHEAEMDSAAFSAIATEVPDLRHRRLGPNAADTVGAASLGGLARSGMRLLVADRLGYRHLGTGNFMVTAAREFRGARMEDLSAAAMPHANMKRQIMPHT